MNPKWKQILKDKSGAVAIYVGLVGVALIMFTALTIDVNHVYGVRNELQNAADAGALAGASSLMDDSTSDLTVEQARAAAIEIATSNTTGKKYVAEPEVRIGHWSFIEKEFTASENTTQADWQGRSFEELDGDLDFINAVKVTTARGDTPSFFAKIFGIDGFEVRADAIAWIGFAGTLFVDDVDWPLAICEEAITVDGVYQCNVGRMLNDGNNSSTAETAMWTNYSQPCTTASNSDMKSITGECDAGNKAPLQFGQGMGTQNGVQDNIFDNLVKCWTANADSDGDNVPDQPWTMVLPVIDCSESNTCSPLRGAVEVVIPWIVHKNDPQMKEVPRKMGDWSCPESDDGLSCWKKFVDHFQLENLSGPPETDADYQDMYQKKNVFFQTSCNELEPRGTSGGDNFGVWADVPVLVE